MSSSLVRLELRWKCKRGSLVPAIHSVGQTLDALDQGGFIIGKGVSFANASSYVHADEKTGTISIHAWFIGPGAWKAALSEHHSTEEDGPVFRIDDFGLRTTEPEVIDRTKGLHRPAWSCRASLGSKPVLRLQACPDMMTPPIISEDRRLIPMWKLGLSSDTRNALHAWNQQARAIASLAPALDDEGLYLKWAQQQLDRKRSPLALEAKRLAALVTKESGCKVLAGPAVDPMGGF
jgi:hypothetical protein